MACLTVSPTDDNYSTIGREYTSSLSLLYLNQSTFPFLLGALQIMFFSTFHHYVIFIFLVFVSPSPISPTNMHLRKKKKTWKSTNTCLYTLVLADNDWLAWIGIFVAENFLMGYHMVFDRENWRFGWSSSDCKLYFLKIFYTGKVI